VFATTKINLYSSSPTKNMIHSRMISIASLYHIFSATILVCSAVPQDTTATPSPAPLPTGQADDRNIALMRDYESTFERYIRDDGLGVCNQKQCQEACGVTEDRIPQGCVQDGVTPKWKREEEQAVEKSVTCLSTAEWQSTDGSGEAVPGKSSM